jgi:hypothetical protein
MCTHPSSGVHILSCARVDVPLRACVRVCMSVGECACVCACVFGTMPVFPSQTPHLAQTSCSINMQGPTEMRSKGVEGGKTPTGRGPCWGPGSQHGEEVRREEEEQSISTGEVPGRRRGSWPGLDRREGLAPSRSLGPGYSVFSLFLVGVYGFPQPSLCLLRLFPPAHSSM